MTKFLFAGAALAALIGVAQPAYAANLNEADGASASARQNPDSAVASFYAARNDAPLWLSSTGSLNAAGLTLVDALANSDIDGFSSGQAVADEARALTSGNAAPDSLKAVDRRLTEAFVDYVAYLHSAPSSVQIVSNWVAPTSPSAAALLARAASAPSLNSFVTDSFTVNPVYDSLRQAALECRKLGQPLDDRVTASLERARIAPHQSRYVMVDTASARLFMIENGRIVDSMKVIVGKSKSPTPLVASTIYSATFNPYWHVPDDLMQRLIGPRIVAQGVKYITDHNYDVLAGDEPGAAKLDPTKVDWQGVVNGTVHVRLRQRPNPANSMGTMKFAFANDSQVYLHDTPEKDLFADDSRQLSNGCIRLEDAPRLARWLMAGKALPATDTPEQDIALPTPTPIYVTYLTARADDGRIALADDPYGLDISNGGGTRVAGR